LSQYLIEVPRPFPEKPFHVRRRYLIVVPWLLPAVPLAVRCTYLAWCPGHWLRRRYAAAAGEGRSADEQRSRENITSFICTEVR
jgi:hypothetical protein